MCWSIVIVGTSENPVITPVRKKFEKIYFYRWTFSKILFLIIVELDQPELTADERIL